MNGSGKGQIAAYVAAALLLLVGAAYLLRGEGGSGSAAAGGGVAMDGAGGGAARGGAGSAPGAGSGASAAPAAGRPVFVHVAGAVRRPGIYRVRPGARVAAAVKKAGGLTRRADLAAFNLATTLRDAQQVIVPRRGEVAANAATAGAGAPGGAAPAGGAPGQPISLSSATPEQLDGLDGIGPKLSQAIIGYRNQHKGFKSVAELKEVDGIGEKRFATLSKAVRP